MLIIHYTANSFPRKLQRSIFGDLFSVSACFECLSIGVQEVLNSRIYGAHPTFGTIRVLYIPARDKFCFRGRDFGLHESCRRHQEY
jgi:hypothetical protein